MKNGITVKTGGKELDERTVQQKIKDGYYDIDFSKLPEVTPIADKRLKITEPENKAYVESKVRLVIKLSGK